MLALEECVWGVLGSVRGLWCAHYGVGMEDSVRGVMAEVEVDEGKNG